jgi:hypothetical protein
MEKYILHITTIVTQVQLPHIHPPSQLQSHTYTYPHISNPHITKPTNTLILSLQTVQGTSVQIKENPIQDIPKLL